MPSKGVQVYTFISVPGCQVEYSVPGSNLVRNEVDQWSNDHLEVDKEKIHGPFNFTGRFAFKVTENDAEVTSQWCDINTMTGNLEQSTMKAMRDQKSIIRDNLIVTYGFYDADQGEAGLPNSDQCWVTVTPNHANWMGSIAPGGSPQAQRKFSCLVLPAAHDIGMNSMQNCDAVIAHAGKPLMGLLKVTNEAVSAFAGKMSEDVLTLTAPNIVSSLAVTQKDTLEDVLNIGARYFEFRPAHLHSSILPANPLPDKLYFQHGPITGMAYEEFLHGCVDFLKNRQDEIIVVQTRWDGVPAECAHPSDQELNDYLNSALSTSDGSIVAGNIDDMHNLTIEDLRNQHKRLIVLNSVDAYSTCTYSPLFLSSPMLTTSRHRRGKRDP
jgi:hypothetical protein